MSLSGDELPATVYVETVARGVLGGFIAIAGYSGWKQIKDLRQRQQKLQRENSPTKVRQRQRKSCSEFEDKLKKIEKDLEALKRENGRLSKRNERLRDALKSEKEFVKNKLDPAIASLIESASSFETE